MSEETRQTIIGLAGPKGSGKTTLANLLVAQYNFYPTSFATPIKAMINALIQYQNGYNPIELAHLDKESSTSRLGGRSPRWAMQTLGTEWGRNLIHPDIWIFAWRSHVKNLPRICVDDVRFPNEIETIKSLGGKVIRVARESAQHSADPHVSEAELPASLFDFTIYNVEAEPKKMLRDLERAGILD